MLKNSIRTCISRTNKPKSISPPLVLVNTILNFQLLKSDQIEYIVYIQNITGCFCTTAV